MKLRNEIKTVARGWRWGLKPAVPRSVGLGSLERSEFPTEWARSAGGRAARKGILALGFAPLLRLETDIQVYGLEMLEKTEPPVIFAANHSSHLDAPLILTSLPPEWRDRTAVGAASDYFFDVWWRAVGTALAFNTFPVERAGSHRTSGLAPALIEEGWNVLVFPEGTRSRDGWMGKFRHGTARLAQYTGVPIVPIAIRGSYQAMPRGRNWPVPGRPPVNVRFGIPIDPSPGEEPGALSARVRAELACILDEDRTSWWEAIKARERGELTDPSGPDAAPWRRLWESSRPLEPRRARRAWPARDGR